MSIQCCAEDLCDGGTLLVNDEGEHGYWQWMGKIAATKVCWLFCIHRMTLVVPEWWFVAALLSYYGRSCESKDRPFCFTAVASFSFFFRHLISEFAWPIVTKLCHMVDSDQDLYNLVRKLGGPFPPKFGGPKNIKFLRNFTQFHDLIANICRMQQDIISRKQSCKLRTLSYRQT